MNGLKVQDFHGKQVVDSRDVAGMVERPHNDVMKSIRLYVKYLGEGGISHTGFFIESTYQDKQGKQNPCYLVTRKGCDMIANKLNGKKGVLFTAAYVSAFDEMQRKLDAPKKLLRLPEGVTFSSVVGFLRIARRAILDAGGTAQDVCAMISDTCNAVSFPVPPSLTKQIPGQIDLFNRAGLEVYNETV